MLIHKIAIVAAPLIVLLLAWAIPLILREKFFMHE